MSLLKEILIESQLNESISDKEKDVLGDLIMDKIHAIVGDSQDDEIEPDDKPMVDMLNSIYEKLGL